MEIFEGVLEFESKDDDGQAMIARIDNDNGLFIRFQSWDETKEHKEFDKFVNKRVRITVEVIE